MGPARTRENYLLAVRQLAAFLAGPEIVGFVGRSRVEWMLRGWARVWRAVGVRRGHVRWFLVWIAETRSAATALNKFKGLQQFFRYLVGEGELSVSPMEGISQPAVPEKVVPVVEDGDLGRSLSACAGFCVIATVVSAGRWKTGQLRPGRDVIRFREVSLEEALTLADRLEYATHPKHYDILAHHYVAG
ncbi:hypothetical protein [Amycolatopsis pigmentata]|uniref:Uncharacterized protein n=1 Tax=Amycolatopsis pigmentata TaxID=450801 RepID=A0ABW5G701_9PSEU